MSNPAYQQDVKVAHLVELAALVAAHHSHLIETSARIPDTVLEEYWRHTRIRTRLWMNSIETAAAMFSPAQEPDQDSIQTEVGNVLQEVFAAEVLTRVWGAVLTAKDQRWKTFDGEPVARTVLAQHSQARNRAMTFLLQHQNEKQLNPSRIDRTRRSCERWTDCLLGPIVNRYDVGEFAHDTSRAIEFGRDQQAELTVTSSDHVWSFVLAGLRLAFSMTPLTHPIHADAHRGIMNAVLGSFPAGAFSNDGPFKSILAHRVYRSSEISDRLFGVPQVENTNR